MIDQPLLFLLVALAAVVVYFLVWHTAGYYCAPRLYEQVKMLRYGSPQQRESEIVGFGRTCFVLVWSVMPWIVGIIAALIAINL